ncbi:MAG TPA: DUF6789 family protein [Armatimonadota bacterium]|jgi:hypothetical protein
MNNVSSGKAMVGGFVGTAVMTVMLYAANMMGLVQMDLAGMVGSMMNGGHHPPMMSGIWWLGMMVHFVNGSIVFPLVYTHFVHRILPGAPVVRGLLWGTALWLGMETMAFPMVGLGFFGTKTPSPMMMVAGPMMLHIVYGAILGAIAGAPAKDHGGEWSSGAPMLAH